VGQGECPINGEGESINGGGVGVYNFWRIGVCDV
jgi:hypothetical protein